jgi:hypothetical protein
LQSGEATTSFRTHRGSELQTAHCKLPSNFNPSIIELMESSNYPRPSDSRGLSFGPDRVWGTIFIVLYALMLAVALLIVLGFAGLFSTVAAPQQFGIGRPGAALFGAGFAAIAGTLVSVVLGVHILGAVGIRGSRPWGFWATIALSILSLASSGGGTCLTIVPLVYSILRLTGVYGPKPA